MAITSNNDAIEQIKERTDIIEIVSEHVVLKKSGRNFWGCCPFHKEKTPSMSVNPEKGIFKCFGCGVGGDAISFLMKLNNSPFMDVISDLAARYGIELPKFGFSSEKTELKNSIIEANNATTAFYTKNLLTLKEAETARKYLINRGITEDIINKFGLGFAQNSPDALSKYLISEKKFTAEALTSAGLILDKNNNKGYLDRFRNRIIIPLYSEKGDVIAFGARALEENQNPKYLNSPETAVYHKSKTLYGLFQAKDSIKSDDQVLIMEGYFDVITAHVYGLTNAVATCGTSLTEQHLKILSKYTMSRKIYLAFDSDTAGQTAAQRGAEVIKNTLDGIGEIKQFEESYANNSQANNNIVCEIRVVTTEAGKDPDEYIRNEGVESYKRCIKNAPLLIDYQINSIMKSKDEMNSPQGKFNISKKIIPILSEINNGIILDEYIRTVSQQLSIDIDTLKTEVNNYKKGVTKTEKIVKRIVTISLKKHVFAQKNLLSLFFINSERLPYSCINEMIKNVEFSEPNLIIIKNTIEQISIEVTNDKNLADKLFTIYAENQEIKEELVDIMYSINDKMEMVESENLKQFVEENINCIHNYYKTKETEQLKSLYHNSDNDEAADLQYQYQVREQVKLNRQRLELINGEEKK
jgi:DNA primase